MSKPAPNAGANTKRRLLPESSAFLLCRAPLFLRFDATRYETVIIKYATTRVSIAEASAAKRAEEKVIRTAAFPKGTSDARWARMTHRGTPGGCATPRP